MSPADEGIAAAREDARQDGYEDFELVFFARNGGDIVFQFRGTHDQARSAAMDI